MARLNPTDDPNFSDFTAKLCNQGMVQRLVLKSWMTSRASHGGAGCLKWLVSARKHTPDHLA